MKKDYFKGWILVWNKTAVHADVPLRAIKLNATGGVFRKQ